MAIHWATNRLRKYLHNVPFKIATDHKALEFIYNPEKSLARNSAATVQRWAVDLSSYCYTIEHRSAKQIPHADFLSRYSRMEPPEQEFSILLLQPLPVRRDEIYEAIFQRQFQEFYKHREELCVSPDGILSLNDRIVVPPDLRLNPPGPPFVPPGC